MVPQHIKLLSLTLIWMMCLYNIGNAKIMRVTFLSPIFLKGLRKYFTFCSVYQSFDTISFWGLWSNVVKLYPKRIIPMA